MNRIGGKTYAVVQCRGASVPNGIGEQTIAWPDFKTIKGWLDLQAGDSKYINYNAKIQESTHVFLCDFDRDIAALSAEKCRLKVGSKLYDVLLIDNPCELDEQLEIYLRFVGGQA